MKLGFVFDARFVEYNGEYYSTNLSQEFWKKRYLNFFDEIVVIGRCIHTTEDPSQKSVKSSSERVHFCCIKESSNIHRIITQKQQHDFIKSHILGCDRVICRGWWGTSACKELRIPYMIEVVNCIRDSFWNYSFLGKIVAFPNYILQRHAVRNAPFVLYVTQSFLQERYPTQNYSVGISDVDLMEVSAEQKELLINNRTKRIENHEDVIRIGTAAAVSVRYKGQQFVIKALADLKSRGITNVEYQLVGSGEATYLKNIAKKYGVENQLKILGPIPHEKMFEWYDSIDLYIQPSLQEGLPRALVEAMSRGLPCIGSNTGGIPELLDSKYIFDKHKSIEKQIVDIYCSLDKNEMKKMSKQNMKKAEMFDAQLLSLKRNKFLSEFCKN